MKNISWKHLRTKIIEHLDKKYVGLFDVQIDEIRDRELRDNLYVVEVYFTAFFRIFNKIKPYYGFAVFVHRIFHEPRLDHVSELKEVDIYGRREQEDEEVGFIQ